MLVNFYYNKKVAENLSIAERRSVIMNGQIIEITEYCFENEQPKDLDAKFVGSREIGDIRSLKSYNDHCIDRILEEFKTDIDQKIDQYLKENLR